MKITNCRSCHSRNIKPIASLGKQTLSEFPKKLVNSPSFYLDLVLCEECKLLQLEETVPPSKLYTNQYGYRSGINDTMRNHLRELVVDIEDRVDIGIGDVVVDIGSNDATLLLYYPHTTLGVGFDLVKKFEKYYDAGHLEFINEPFNKESFYEWVGEDEKAKVITAISMFYDLDDPNTFVKDLKDILAPDGIIVIQQNYLVGMLKQTAFDNVVHEHLEYYSLTSLEHLLNKHGLEVFDVQTNDLNGGSFRTYVRHSSELTKMRQAEKDMGLDTPAPYKRFGNNIQDVKTKLFKLVKRLKQEGNKVYVYGASTRGNTLLQACGLNSKYIDAAVERNPEKFGKVYGSLGIPIISEAQARRDKPEYMLVLPWFFKDEFLKREKEYLDNGGHFIFPLPKVEIV